MPRVDLPKGIHSVRRKLANGQTGKPAGIFMLGVEAQNFGRQITATPETSNFTERLQIQQIVQSLRNS